MTDRKKKVGLRNFADPAAWRVEPHDKALFDAKLADFVPPNAFDAHAHWYDLRDILPNDDLSDLPSGNTRVAFDEMQTSMRRWMGERATGDGLFFGFPTRTVDCLAANRLIADQIAAHPGCAGLMLIRPDDQPERVEQDLREGRFSGFKVYHLLTNRADSFQCEQQEFLPDWAWDLAHQYGLWITMHMVLPKALSDPRNLTYIQRQCRQWPNARLVLAHAARGFNASHTVDAIDGLRGIDNVYFDTSAICEPAAFEAILRATGTTRLMYGSDFPVSEVRGRALSLGDGFSWLYEHNVDLADSPHGALSLIGIESLLALQQACRTMCLVDRDLERIFGANARQLLSINAESRGDDVRRAAEAEAAELARTQYEQAKQRIPGGVQLLSKRPEMFAPNHWPAYYEQAIGCEVVDTAGRRFIDMSLGGILACPLGFADPDVNAAVIRRVHLGSMATQQTRDEVRLAELLTTIHPWASMARFTRSGGEAMSVAVRIARAATDRDVVAICGYHGWHDWYLAANLAGDSALEGHLLPGLQPSGVPTTLAGTTLPFHYNQLDQLDAIIAEQGDRLAAIVMEPMRHTLPEQGFLEGVKERATRIGAKLVFDEISIGWRYCLGGAHLTFGVEPDLAVFAKAISNGFAMGAVIGNHQTMSAAQHSFISSTYWTEGVGPAAALATIEKLIRHDAPAHFRQIGALFKNGWRELGERLGVSVLVSGRPDAIIIAFDHPDANALMTLFTIRMLEHGILACGGFNPTLAHEAIHVERYFAAASKVLVEIRESIEQGDVAQRIDGQPKHTTFARLTD